MKSSSREIRRLNIKPFFNRRGLGVVTIAAEAAFCYLGSKRLPALSTICLFGCLARVWKFVCRLSFSKHFSAVHSIVIVSAGYIRLLFKLSFKFRNVLQRTEAGVEAPLLVIKISKKTFPQSWRFYLL